MTKTLIYRYTNPSTGNRLYLRRRLNTPILEERTWFLIEVLYA